MQVNKISHVVRAAIIAAEVFFIGLLDYSITDLIPADVGHYVSLDVLYCIPIIQTAHLTSLRKRRKNDTYIPVVAGVAVALVWSGVEAALSWPYFPAIILVLNTFTRSLVFTIIGSLLIKLWQEKALARVDPLTGLANRAELLERLEIEQRRSERTRRPYSLLLLDIDNFKTMNDVYGHLGGDEALKVMAKILRSNSRSTDLAGRFGGDEFVMLLPDTDGTSCDSLIQRIEASAQLAFAEKSWPISLSVGHATLTGTEHEMEQAIQLADENMYAKKRTNKDLINANNLIGRQEEVLSSPG
jgi:diguanylate cyclase (GGDEF)-like protein